MLKYFLKHFGQALLFLTAVIGFGWAGVEIGKFVGGQLENESYSHIVTIGFIFLVGMIFYAYGQAKVDVKYQSK
tara:strand:- start:1050 stop:1271 length:222 start_codon:yes stop_codon:yes gene_type:complete